MSRPGEADVSNPPEHLAGIVLCRRLFEELSFERRQSTS